MHTKIFAHRGSKGAYPENTIQSFNKAIQEKTDGIEIDVHLTKDNHIVVVHDEVVKTISKDSGYVKDFSIMELSEINVPTLQEVLELVKNKDITLNIELKTTVFKYEGIEETVISIVKDYANQHVVYSSFHLPTILRIKKLDPHADIAWLLQNVTLPHPKDYINTLGLESIHLEKETFFSNIDYYKDIYDKLRIWTVNNGEEMKKLANLEVKGIITDYPNLAIKN